ncbi:aminotransferase class V-fold PLP-dependent enzyme [Streptomyces sp. NPDC001843]|uniref:aminotransferase class V-fold PLP-dependent enzyme n=1 Tax=Streptomyces sp. NPDC001843 TaxID=3364617 RepID=UPI0036CE7A35
MRRAQSPGCGLLNVAELGVNLAPLSAHKLHGPKGIGALYICGGTRITAQQTGGGQERGLRADTPTSPPSSVSAPPPTSSPPTSSRPRPASEPCTTGSRPTS